MLLIRHIKSLLYEEGFTISGARQKLLAIKLAENDNTLSLKDEICQELEMIASLLKIKA